MGKKGGKASKTASGGRGKGGRGGRGKGGRGSRGINEEVTSARHLHRYGKNTSLPLPFLGSSLFF